MSLVDDHLTMVNLDIVMLEEDLVIALSDHYRYRTQDNWHRRLYRILERLHNKRLERAELLSERDELD